MKYSFKNDYSEGAHPNILQALMQSNMDQEQGYGYDTHSQNAIQLIRDTVQDENAKIHFISGGTQTNLIAIGGFLRPHEACIAAETGHIAVHEAGAIESTGHKVCTIRTDNGKLCQEQIQGVLDIHQDEHMVLPRLVYISNPTELGTVYTKDELHSLSTFCKEKDLMLYCDGARLGTVLCQDKYNLSLKDMYDLTDAFFIGGTKNGALLGEALVIRNTSALRDIEYFIKQKGALLAKGRLMGIQFEELFKDGLFYELAMHSINQATIIAEAFKNNGCEFLVPNETNQIFPIIDKGLLNELNHHFDFYVWKEISEDTSAIRLVTSWATTDQSVNKLIEILNAYLKK